MCAGLMPPGRGIIKFERIRSSVGASAAAEIPARMAQFLQQKRESLFPAFESAVQNKARVASARRP
jgi:hypothetical protein